MKESAWKKPAQKQWDVVALALYILNAVKHLIHTEQLVYSWVLGKHSHDAVHYGNKLGVQTVRENLTKNHDLRETNWNIWKCICF